VVREDSTVPWRVYRPVIVVGDSRTGEMDKVDGPYYFLPFLATLGQLPAVGRVPLVLPDPATPTWCPSTTWQTRWTR
jgi:thioester reductase-like protein